MTQAAHSLLRMQLLLVFGWHCEWMAAARQGVRTAAMLEAMTAALGLSLYDMMI